jgi:hypothetical protein
LLSINGTAVVSVFEFVLHRRLRFLILRKEVVLVICIISSWFEVIKVKRTCLIAGSIMVLSWKPFKSLL